MSRSQMQMGGKWEFYMRIVVIACAIGYVGLDVLGAVG